MDARIVIDVTAATPPFAQIRAQLSSLITIGELAPGTRLPTVRSLAQDLGVAAGTVARAYKDLESGGLVETRRRHGTVVTERPGALAAGGSSGVDHSVLDAVDHLVAAGRTAGLDDATLLQLLAGRLRQEPGTRRPESPESPEGGRHAVD